MQWLLLLFLVHVLCWATVGICLAEHSGLARSWCAIISVCLPVIGAVLLGLAGYVRSHNLGSGEALGRQWRLGCWIGVAISVGVLVSSWLTWVDIGAVGEVGQFRHEQSRSTDSLAILAFAGTVVAAAMGVSCLAGWRYGRRLTLIAFAILASIPATLGLAVFAMGALVAGLTAEVDNWLNTGLRELIEYVCSRVEQDQQCSVIMANVQTHFTVHEGAALGLACGAAGLVWGLTWSLKEGGQPAMGNLGFRPVHSRMNGVAQGPYSESSTYYERTAYSQSSAYSESGAYYEPTDPPGNHATWQGEQNYE